MIDLYELFQTEETSTQEDIKKKYRELCFKYHPDKNNGDDETFNLDHCHPYKLDLL